MTAPLALRHRPHRLVDVVGQRHATSVLQRALANGALPQQILFSGGSGLGKTTLARCVAAALLCADPVDGDACGACESCCDIADPTRLHPDVVEFDAASNGQKEQIRELASRAQTAPVRGSHRVYIIDEAHGLSLGGGQAFLKLLEEPPAHVVFMLATTDPDKMLQTNRGRCVEFELQRPSDEELVAHLLAVAGKENWSLDEPGAQMIVAATDPVLGVRGLLMELAKLSSVLTWGTPPSADEVAALVGLPATATVAGLIDLIEAHDPAGLLCALDDARQRHSDASVRTALVRALRQRVLSDRSALASWRFQRLASAPPGALATDVACCAIAAPHLDATPEALAAVRTDASAVIEELSALLRTAQTVAVVADSAPHDPVEAVCDALVESDHLAASLALRSARAFVEDDQLVLAPADTATLDALLSARDEIRAAAQACGLRVVLRRPSTAAS